MQIYSLQEIPKKWSKYNNSLPACFKLDLLLMAIVSIVSHSSAV